MPGLVQRSHHLLELLHLLAAVAGRAVLVVRREVADRVVAPVVAQTHLHEAVVVHELVHRLQLDRGHAEIDQVVDDLGCREPGVGAAEFGGTAGCVCVNPLTCSSYTSVSCNGVSGGRSFPQSKNGFVDDRLRHEARAVARAHPVLVAEAVRVDGVPPSDRPVTALP